MLRCLAWCTPGLESTIFLGIIVEGRVVPRRAFNVKTKSLRGPPMGCLGIL